MTTTKESAIPQVHQGDCLSWGDSFFLYLEREGQPLSIASISEFEGEISVQDCVRFIESKLHLIPRYRQRVVFPPFNVGLPVWEFDPNFNVRHHVRQVKLKQGTDAELKVQCGKVLSTILPRSRPLWDFTIFRGLKGKRTAILARVHHCLADGIAGVRLMNVLMDTEPEPGPLPKPESFETPSPRDSGSLLLDGLFRSYFSVIEHLLTFQADLFQAAQHVLSIQGEKTTEAPAKSGSELPLPTRIETLKELACLTDRLPFNRVCWGPHNIAWTQISLHEIKAVKNAFDTTVNNVLLTVLTSAIRRYSEIHGVQLAGRQMRVVVPVNVRGDDSPDHLGNRITFLPINVPLDIADDKQLLITICEKMEVYKATRVAGMVGLLGTLVGALPTMFQAAAAPILSQLPLPLVNTIITNVPGPQVPLYVMGHKMLRWYPVVPIGGEMGMNIALLSYNGCVYFGFHGDVQAVPDVERMEELAQKSFAELLASAQAETNASKRKTGKTPVTAKKKISKRSPATRKVAASKKEARGRKPRLTVRKPTTAAAQASRVNPEPAGTPEEVTASTDEAVATGAA
jgi:diacylglycerol O-acyltransferase